MNTDTYRRGIALLMVIMTLSALLLIGVPFFISMIGFTRTGDASTRSEITETGSYGSVQWAIDSLALSDEIINNEPAIHYGRTGGADPILDPDDLPAELKDRNPLHSGVRVQDETGRIDVNSLTLQLASNLVHSGIHSQASYKMVLWPVRPEGNQVWVSEDSTPEAPREAYRPFRAVSGIREIANVLNIDKEPVPQDPPDDIGYLSRDSYLNIRDCLRIDYERIKTGRWFKAGVLVKDSVVNDTIINMGFSPVVSTGTLIYIRDRETGDREYNFCRSVSCSVSDAQKNRMKLSLLFGLRHNYSEGAAYISIPERIPVNINTASYKVLKAVLWGIQGTIKGSAVTIAAEDAEAVAADIVSRREGAPFGPDRFMEYDIASVIDSATPAHNKAALIKLHAFNPYDRRLAVSTVGFLFASDRTFRISGISSVVNPHAGLQTFRNIRETVVSIYPGVQGSEAVWGSSTQYELLQDRMFRGGGLLTGPNPLQTSDYGTVPLGDLGTKNGIQDFEDSDTGAASYVTLAPLKLYWNTGCNEKTSFVLHTDSGTKSTILDGDKGLGLYSTGAQDNRGTAAVYDAGSADAAKNDLTPEGIALGTDDGEEDFLEYEMHDGDDGSDCKLRRDPAFDDIVYEGFSFECWLKPGTWDDADRYYLFDTRHVNNQEFRNRVSFLYDRTLDEPGLVLRLADTSIKQGKAGSPYPLNVTELRQKASFTPGLWYHVKAIVRGGGRLGSGACSTDNKIAILVDGKPCWKVDPAHADDETCRPKLFPGADLRQDISDASTVVQLDNTDTLPVRGVVQIGAECIEYRSKGAQTLNQCIRGCRGTVASNHTEGDRAVLFGYTCDIVAVNVMKGEGLLQDTIKSGTEMPEVTVPTTDNPPDGVADWWFDTTFSSITLPPGSYSFDDFPDKGFLKVESGTSNAIVYYLKTGSKTIASLNWSLIQTTEEQAGTVVFPPDKKAGPDIVFRVISICVSDNTEYPAATEFDNSPKRGYIQIGDEWFEYGRDECQSGTFTHNPGTGDEYYFIGDDSMRSVPGMGDIAQEHNPDDKVIPVFRVDNANNGPMLSNDGSDYPRDVVTIIDIQDGSDPPQENAKEQMRINRSGIDSGSRHWIAFDDFTEREYQYDEEGTRIVKFPSGEMPVALAETAVIGNSRHGTDPLEAEVDEICINRSGYRTARIINIDGTGEINNTETIDGSNTRYIEITRTWTSANQDKGDDFRNSGFIRINCETFAYIFDSALTGPERYKLKLIRRGCFNSRQAVHRVSDTVFILEGIPCTTVVHPVEDLNADRPRIFVRSTEGFPPSGFIRIDNEIIGYTFKGDMTGWQYFGMEKEPDPTNPVGFWRGRYGTDPAAHGEDALVTLFSARYPDRTPLRFEGGSVTHRWDPAHGIFFRKVITRDSTVFGIAGEDGDLSVKASLLDGSGNRQPLPSGVRVRILVGAGRNIDWTQDPSGTSADFDPGLQKFEIGEGEGGVSAVSFDLGARRTDRLEMRVFFEYLSGAWQSAKDGAICDPSGEGIFSWKMCPVIEEITLKVKGRSAVYETLRY